MRCIGSVTNKTHAERLSAYLVTLGIDNDIEAKADSEEWLVWIIDEDQLSEARAIYHEFLNTPDASHYQHALKQSDAIRKQQAAEEKAAAKRMYTRDQLWPSRGISRGNRCTWTLIILSIGISLVAGLGSNTQVTKWLWISNYVAAPGYPWWIGLSEEIGKGQVWRLITPTFLHLGFFHILFNMLWLKDLGSTIEQNKGTWYLALMVIAIAIPSNLAQYVYAGGSFGGMSGVVYGLLGYIWMKGKFDPGSGMHLHSTTVTMMLVWLLLGFAGFMHMANMVHLVGLIIGVAWGYLSSKFHHLGSDLK